MGSLYIVSTPIGNMKDITLRALEILFKVQVILAEDTRKTSQLLRVYKNDKEIPRLVSFYEENESRRNPEVIEWLKSGLDVALVSDAGTPLISDPGFKLVRQCVEENIKIVPIPGASALLAGLTVAGLPTDKFIFLGFLPKKTGKKEKLLKKALGNKMTIVFYESPFRILKTLKTLDTFHPGMELKVVVGRELTKKFEEVLRGTPEELIKGFGDKKIKGELVVLVN
ncbi:MAG: 16S rRNA (cytidine(1402)-2'-O)-methyltransferase [Patescibacteria group bacterium]|nr:16S rRNA (cytidine(1402)-2'-O)-methyltransferase [Patescibacteria group bacterium]